MVGSNVETDSGMAVYVEMFFVLMQARFGSVGIFKVGRDGDRCRF